MTLRTIALLMPWSCSRLRPKPLNQEGKPKQETRRKRGYPTRETWSGWWKWAHGASDVSGDMNTYRSIVNLTKGSGCRR